MILTEEPPLNGRLGGLPSACLDFQENTKISVQYKCSLIGTAAKMCQVSTTRGEQAPPNTGTHSPQYRVTYYQAFLFIQSAEVQMSYDNGLPSSTRASPTRIPSLLVLRALNSCVSKFHKLPSVRDALCPAFSQLIVGTNILIPPQWEKMYIDVEHPSTNNHQKGRGGEDVM